MGVRTMRDMVAEQPRGPSLLMRLVCWYLGRDEPTFGPKGFETLRKEIAQREYPAPMTPPAKLAARCDVKTINLDGQPVFTLTPRERASDLHIIYLHGGAYVLPLGFQHWAIIGQLIERLGATVTVPAYPIAPEHSHRRAFVLLDALWREVAEQHGQRLVLAGDSAGAGLALAQALRLRDAGQRLPERLALICPWIDLTLPRPEAAAIEPSDLYLGVDGLRQCGQWWAAGESLHSPLLSPLYGELAGLPPMDVFIGTRDILLPDARALAERVAAAGGECNLSVYPGAFHVFPAATFTREAKDVFSKLEGRLQRAL